MPSSPQAPAKHVPHVTVTLPPHAVVTNVPHSRLAAKQTVDGFTWQAHVPVVWHAVPPPHTPQLAIGRTAPHRSTALSSPHERPAFWHNSASVSGWQTHAPLEHTWLRPQVPHSMCRSAPQPSTIRCVPQAFSAAAQAGPSASSHSQVNKLVQRSPSAQGWESLQSLMPHRPPSHDRLGWHSALVLHVAPGPFLGSQAIRQMRIRGATAREWPTNVFAALQKIEKALPRMVPRVRRPSPKSDD